jgi:catechol 2,3-dioxygenase-like lactoylglutathione lyase family enzyme
MFHIHGLVPELWCSNFNETLRFYTEVLGFAVTQRRGSDYHAYLELGDAQLMIAHWEQDGTWEPAPLEKPYGRGVNFFILVEDVRAIYDSVLSAGVEPFVALHTRSYWRSDRMDERTEFGVLDPDGYLLRFSQVESYRPTEQSDLDQLDRKRAPFSDDNESVER